MANDTTLRIRYPTGATLYTQIESGTGIWNGTAYTTFTVASWSTFATATPETPSSSGRYVCQFPTSSAAGNYTWSTFLQAGGSPASTDVCVGTGTGYWDGTTFGGSSMVTGSVNSVVTGVSTNVIHSGTARGGTSNTITLDTGASSIDNTYQMNQITLNGGTGVGQTAVILYGGYVGSTRVATVSAPWATNPDSTTTFQIFPQGAVVLGQIGGGTRTVTQDYLGTNSLAVVSQATGNPIASATVTAYLASAFSSQGTNAPVVDSTTTNSTGGWTLNLAPSAYVVVFAFASESSQATFTVS